MKSWSIIFVVTGTAGSYPDVRKMNKLFVAGNILVRRVLIGIFVLLPMITCAEISSKCPGEQGYFYINNYDGNPTVGGFVSNAADVDVTVRISPLAAVCGSASVLDNARIYGHAVISGEAVVAENARVFGNARIKDHAIVKEKASVSGMAIISGDAIIDGNAVIRGWSRFKEGNIDSGLHAAEKQPEDELEAQKNSQDEAKLACTSGLISECLKWEECDGLSRGDCAQTVVDKFNKVLEKCHENGMYKKITRVKEGFYKKFVVVEGEKVICNSDEKKIRVSNAEMQKDDSEKDKTKEKEDDESLVNEKWCSINTPSTIEKHAIRCVNTCEQMTGHTKTPKAYYDACMAICGKNKKIRLSRFDKRCEIDL